MTRRPTTGKDNDGAINRLRCGFVIVRQTVVRNVPTGLARNASLAQLDAALNSAIEGLLPQADRTEPADGG